MNDVLTLFQIGALLTFVVAPPVLLSRWLADSDGPALADAFRIPLDAPWPRGVQEEEPVRWRIETMSRHRRAGEGTAERPDRDLGPAVELGIECG